MDLIRNSGLDPVTDGLRIELQGSRDLIDGHVLGLGDTKTLTERTCSRQVTCRRSGDGWLRLVARPGQEVVVGDRFGRDHSESLGVAQPCADRGVHLAAAGEVGGDHVRAVAAADAV
jgi:hypothetical protein